MQSHHLACTHLFVLFGVGDQATISNEKSRSENDDLSHGCGATLQPSRHTCTQVAPAFRKRAPFPTFVADPLPPGGASLRDATASTAPPIPIRPIHRTPNHKQFRLERMSAHLSPVLQNPLHVCSPTQGIHQAVSNVVGEATTETK